MTSLPFQPNLDDLDDELARRVRLTLSCRDADPIPKVAGAGKLVTLNGADVQIMHNGVLIERDCYQGPWMTELIRCLQGHHEPQEELVFQRLVERLASESDASMIELGCWWAYYSLWFGQALPGAVVVAMEPDPTLLETGRRNFELNHQTATFVWGGIGATDPLRFATEGSVDPLEVRGYDLRGLMRAGGLKQVSLVLVDIQGAETTFVEQSLEQLRAGAVRFLILSTHHHSISGDPLTHQRLLSTLRDLGAHVITEHSVGESFSGDGLIAVSFDDRDRDLVVEVSRARQRDSLFGELEFELAAAIASCQATEARLVELRGHYDLTRQNLEAAMERLEATSAEVREMRQTKLWRLARGPRAIYRRVRRRG